MNRRAPVRSVLAERRMFAGGGMLPISTPMQNTMDQGQPSGILASSTPLIDAVSQEILAPITGGAMPMAQGGVAKFRTGGANDLSRQIQYALSIKPDQMYETEGGLYTPDEEVLALLQKLNPNDPLYSDVVNAARERGLSIPQPSVQLAEGPSGLSEEAGPEMPLLLSEKLIEEDEIADVPNVRDSVFASPDEKVGIIPPEQIRKEDVLERGIYYDEEGIAVFPQNPDQVPDDIIYDYSVENFVGDPLTTAQSKADALATLRRPASEKKLDEFSPGPDAAGREVKTLDEFSPSPDAAGREVKDGLPKKSSVFLSDWLANNPDQDPPAEVVNNTVDSVFKDAFEKLETGKKFNVDNFKSEIDALLPQAQDDPEMEGLLIAMLGASILGGKDANWAVNVGKGLEKSLPAIINFKDKQKETQRARDMTIAKLAIETKLSRDKEERSAIRALEAQKLDLTSDMFKAKQSAIRAEEKEQRQTANYMVVKNTTLPGSSFDPEAPKDSTVLIPFNTKMNLSKRDAGRLQGMGIPLWEMGNVTVSYDDVMESTTPAAGASALDPEDWNRLVKGEKATFFNFGTDGGVKLDYYRPEGFGMAQGVNSSFMLDNEWSSLYLAYDRYRNKFERLGNKLVNLNELAKTKKLTGLAGLKGRIGDAIRGMGIAPELADVLLEGDKLSKGTEFDINARLVLAEIAPWILGESGKTISDTDRVRVAQSLGYEGAGVKDGVFKIGGINKSLMDNPYAIQRALNEVANVINTYIDYGDSQMADTMMRFGRVSPEQSKTILDSITSPERYKKQFQERTQQTPQTELGGSGYSVDLDLTQPN